MPLILNDDGLVQTVTAKEWDEFYWKNVRPNNQDAPAVLPRLREFSDEGQRRYEDWPRLSPNHSESGAPVHQNGSTVHDNGKESRRHRVMNREERLAHVTSLLQRDHKRAFILTILTTLEASTSRAMTSNKLQESLDCSYEFLESFKSYCNELGLVGLTIKSKPEQVVLLPFGKEVLRTIRLIESEKQEADEQKAQEEEKRQRLAHWCKMMNKAIQKFSGLYGVPSDYVATLTGYATDRLQEKLLLEEDRPKDNTITLMINDIAENAVKELRILQKQKL